MIGIKCDVSHNYSNAHSLNNSKKRSDSGDYLNPNGTGN